MLRAGRPRANLHLRSFMLDLDQGYVVVARISASEKDLPVLLAGDQSLFFSFSLLYVCISLLNLTNFSWRA